MLKRRPIDLEINHERWLVSYADFVTLLFAFFVVMYSVSHVSENKYQELSESLNEVFSESSQNDSQSAAPVINSQEIDQGKSVVALPVLEDSFYEQLAPLIEDGSIEVTSNELWLQISLNNRILFAVGGVKPIQQANQVIADIAAILSDTNNPINVEGFTDNLAINTAQFPSNWQLSASRAAAIVQLLAANGVASEQLSAVGYGEFHPIADNASAAGRAKNRRVSLMIGKHQQQRPILTTNLSNDKVDIDERLQDLTNSPINSPINISSNTPDNTLESASVANAADQQAAENSMDKVNVKEKIEPIILESGELLFTSDPEAPK
ncbi:MAG: chemotaxis protein MotB [Gammaproteobacteria bacterium]|jgi:chemotaxis protein MotB